MSRLDPPQVLIEATALAAIRDHDHERHDEVLDVYRDLVEQYQRNEVLLVAINRDLRRAPLTPRRGVFAPVDILHVAGQHREAAAQMQSPSPEFALTLVMCQRHGVRRMLTLDDRFAAYDIDLVALSNPRSELDS